MQRRLKIRLARFGKQNIEYFRINVARSGGKRDGKFIERIGGYWPTPRQDGNLHLSLNFTRAKYWLSQGAEPTPTVSHLLRRVGLMPDPRSPDRVSLAPVSPVHADAAGGMGSYAKGGASEFLEETTSQERAAAAWDVARKQGTFKLQQMRRDAERGARRANEDEKLAGAAGMFTGNVRAGSR